jgi:hypothetical protein
LWSYFRQCQKDLTRCFSWPTFAHDLHKKTRLIWRGGFERI